MFRRLVAVVLAAFCLAAAPPDDWERSRPMPEAAKVSLTFDKEQFLVGEPIIAQYTVENTGDASISVTYGGDYRGSPRETRYKVSVVDEKGNEAVDPTPDPMNMGGMFGPNEIKPGEKWVRPVAVLKYREINQPGTYSIRIFHDLGWTEKEGENRRQAEATIKVVLPTPQQAEDAVAAMDKRAGPIDPRRNRSLDPAGFDTLRHPVYLPALVKAAEAGSDRAVIGIGSIETVEATAALIQLLNPKDLGADQQLRRRVPAYGMMDEQFPPNDYRTAEQQRYKRVWDPKFATAVRGKALLFLAEKTTRPKEFGANMIARVGTVDDLPVLLKAIDEVLADDRPSSKENDNTLDPPGASRELLVATKALHKRGAAVPAEPTTSAELAYYFATLDAAEQNRPAGWQKIATAALSHPQRFIRRESVRVLPKDLPEADRPKVVAALTDPDQAVRREACMYVSRSPNPAYKDGVLKAIATATEHFSVDAANKAAVDLGARFDACEIWVDRMNDGKTTVIALRFLAELVEYDGGSGSNSNLEPQEVSALKVRWKAFLREHHERITAGKKFKIGDPELTPDLYGRAFHLYKDGRQWPPEQPR